MVGITMLPAIHLFGVSEVRAATSRVATSWPWYVIRAAGFTAAGLLILLMLSGIGQVTGLTYRFLEPIKAWAVHKALALALCAAIAVHVIFLLFDHYVSFSVPQLLVPFLSHYSNRVPLFGIGTSVFGVALGVLALYSVAIMVLSSLGWIESRQKMWRWLHFLSYFIILAVFLHALSVGSDLKYGTFREAWIALFLVLLLAVVSRLWRVGTLRRKRQLPAGTQTKESERRRREQ